MNKALIILFILIIIIFAVMFYANQQTTGQTASDSSLSLPAQIMQSPTPMFGFGLSDKTSPMAISPGVTEDPGPDMALADNLSVVITTDKGEISLELYPKDAPKTVRNFVNKIKSGYYTNLTFHRVEDWVIQGGDPDGNGTGGGDMPSEFNSRPFVTGSLGVARRNDPDVQNDSQFFITKIDAGWLDNQYTNFGQVTEGMDVVSKIEVNDKIINISIN